MTYFIQAVLDGIISGCIIAMGAIGISLLYSILRFAHFAHGDLMTLGAYLILPISQLLGLPLYTSLIIAIIGVCAVALLIDGSVYRPLRNRNPVILLIASIGVALVLRALVQLIWGNDSLVYESGFQVPYRFAGLRIKADHIDILLLSISAIVALHLLLKYTRTGQAMLAMSQNFDLAMLTGISVGRVIMITWIISSVLMTCAGFVLALDTRLQVTMGWHMLLPIFAAAILGGIGRPYGAIAGGLTLGIASELTGYYLDPTYKPAIAFLIMLTVLIFRPSGIFKQN